MATGLMVISASSLWAQNTPTNTPTNSPTRTATNTPTNSATRTPTLTPTNTLTFIATNTATPTVTNTITITATVATPTFTSTFTSTFTPTVTFTPTNTITITATICQTQAFFGESPTPAAGPVSINGTICQQYVVTQPFQLNYLTIYLTFANPNVSLGIYADNGNYPGNLIWASAVTFSMSAGNNTIFLQAPMGSGNPAGLTLPAGTYWLAATSTTSLVIYPPLGSSAKVVIGPGAMPNGFPSGQPVSTTGQGVIGAGINTCAAGPTQILTFTPNPSTPTNTPTRTPTWTPTNTWTITPTIAATFNCGAWAPVSFYGNLDSTQRADMPGGILQLGTGANPVLPFMASGGLNGASIQLIPYQGGNAMQQVDVFDPYVDAATHALPNHAVPLMMSGVTLVGAQTTGVTTYAWNQGIIPACTTSKSVVDSVGNLRQITVLFYQVNDLGTAVPPVNAGAPATQTAYAWYAFETTGGQPVSNTNLLGGTGIMEGDAVGACSASTDRGNIGDQYWGDFLYFNPDGSLLSEGGQWAQGGIAAQTEPYLYLPPVSNGVLQVRINFGTAGMLGFGQRDGLTGDPGPFTCGALSPVVTNTPTPSPTFSPTPSGPITMIYINSEGACAGAFGCTILFIQQCRQLNLDPTTSYLLMRIGATCGCTPAEIMTLRLTMGWDEIVAYYGLDWNTFAPDLENRMRTLLPERITPNQIRRAAANDPSLFPISNPDVMPVSLIFNSPVTEVCPLCP